MTATAITVFEIEASMNRVSGGARPSDGRDPGGCGDAEAGHDQHVPPAEGLRRGPIGGTTCEVFHGA